MKSILIRTILIASVVALFASRGSAAVSVSISMFQDDLDPYGSWVDVPSYGLCWAPADVSADWQPYTVGEWAYTDYGWTWISHDRWGGLPYHYGTWVWVPRFGWVWIPGTVWAPAWVTWCYGDDYVGWAPVPPSIRFSSSGYFGSPFVVSQTNYVFVPMNRFVGGEISSARIPRQRNAEIFRLSRQRTTNFGVANGVLVNRGPSVQRIEQAAHTRISRQNVSVARVSPTSISAAPRGRLGVIASAPDRARQLHVRSATGVGERHPVATQSGKVGERRQTAPREHKTIQENRKATQSEHVGTPRPHIATPREHNPAPMQHRESPPPHRAVVQNPPPQESRHEAPPRHGIAAGDSPHAASGGGNSSVGRRAGAPPGKLRQAPPKKHEKEPPPSPHR